MRLTILPPSCADVMKSGNLHFLEPSGPLQACNGTTFTALHNLVKIVNNNNNNNYYYYYYNKFISVIMTSCLVGRLSAVTASR